MHLQRKMLIKLNDVPNAKHSRPFNTTNTQFQHKIIDHSKCISIIVFYFSPVAGFSQCSFPSSLLFHSACRHTISIRFASWSIMVHLSSWATPPTLMVVHCTALWCIPNGSQIFWMQFLCRTHSMASTWTSRMEFSVSSSQEVYILLFDGSRIHEVSYSMQYNSVSIEKEGFMSDLYGCATTESE